MLLGTAGLEQFALGKEKSRFNKIEKRALSCQPNLTYEHDFETCVCTRDGEWPNKRCSTHFGEIYKSLPRECEPNTYVKVHCNVCKCDKWGALNYGKCTKHVCERNSGPSNRNSRKSIESVTGKCTLNVWYSFAPCQLCFCVSKNKLVCSPAKNQLKTKYFGKYNFTVCGKMFLKESVDLIPTAGQMLKLDKDRHVAKTQPGITLKNSDEQQEDSNSNEKRSKYIVNQEEDTSEAENNSDKETDDEKTRKDELITQMSFQVDDKPVSKESNKVVNIDLNNESNSNEEEPKVTVKPTIFYPDQLDDDGDNLSAKNDWMQEKIEQENKPYFGLNVANILKVLNLGSRKHSLRKMVSLDSKGTCEPGTKMAVECNTCFCMRNVLHSFAFDYEQPVPSKLWNERCKRNSHVLNDCNWCWCDSSYQYKCHARVCSKVDMFGHFNDAIREIDVGMEGKGVWRTTDSACAPGVHYRRGSVLCVCNEDGYWPNPVCRDIFRILHSVEVTRGIGMSQKCEPTKLYLVGCNVCFCPSTGRLDGELCTKLSCLDDDPVLNATKGNRVIEAEESDDVEVYATCDTSKKYSMGCQTCSCLRNNRLLCGNCTSDRRKDEPESNRTICSEHEVGEVFSVGCNQCFCDESSFLYCTARKCLSRYALNLIDMEDDQFEDSVAPVVDHECRPGTSYNKGCNKCHCSEQSGRTVYTCTLRQCTAGSAIDWIQNDCVNGTVYEASCLICRCDIDDAKRETCIVDRRCGASDVKASELSHGFCQPLHIYNKDCNICQCLANGKVVKCTTRPCNADPVTIDLVPVRAKHPEPCPKGMSYKLECNVCFCLDNGNALCTTNDCRTRRGGGW
ncbi:unnamed protein product, partial [Iphiclides podalirius]